MLLHSTLITFALGISLLKTSTASPSQNVQKWDPNACAVVVCGPAQDGLPGRDGRDGKEGPKGEKGSQGLQGLKGSQGPPGKMGPAGLVGGKGSPGEKGTKGDSGDRGLQGVPGLKGNPGNAGPSGPKGDKGSPGEKGVKGERGFPGTTGSQGKPGIAGSPGPKGDKGSVGEKRAEGDRGLQGSSGLQGPKGQIGSPGLKGDKGSVGEKGTNGDSGLSEINLLKRQVSTLEGQLRALQSSFSKYKQVIMFLNGRIVGEKIFMTSSYEGNFDSLKQRCSQAGGQLASPRNAAENAAIQQIVVLYNKSVFLGINDIQTEGHFKYLNGENIVYSNWQTGKPNNESDVEDCVEVYSSGKWNDKSCGDKRLIVCEF
ncbi:pulmonary surfactant-associated protein D-like isoform X4 [Gopherus flavomarginatus]|uniref:pulmonary surfactant-associated protein D-like isoform X4 n=1 Tax=Gopherus flavomarginatus TaxID=286002 RepID=UPI0021CBA13C|nr:pulmonary surfactant-associated protein D-like isoform X4 [Gopherus flavomarginatus]